MGPHDPGWHNAFREFNRFLRLPDSEVDQVAPIISFATAFVESRPVCIMLQRDRIPGLGIVPASLSFFTTDLTFGLRAIRHLLEAQAVKVDVGRMLIQHHTEEGRHIDLRIEGELTTFLLELITRLTGDMYAGLFLTLVSIALAVLVSIKLWGLPLGEPKSVLEVWELLVPPVTAVILLLYFVVVSILSLRRLAGFRLTIRVNDGTQFDVAE
jgi:hypothetical protein